MKKIYYIIIILIILVSIYAYVRIGSNKEVLSFETTVIEKGNISSIITATGSLEAITTVEVGTQVSGIIQNIFVDFNSEVKSGQTIAILDTTMLHSSLLSAKADLQQRKANMDYYKKNYERVKLLYESNTVAESEYDQAMWNYNTAKANYNASLASLEKARINLNYATIVSPINGVIVSRSVDEGQTVAASFNTPTLFSIAQDLTKMQVVASIDEADIGQVKEGNKVMFTVDAFPDDEFEGEVIQIRLEPTISQNVVTYNVLIDAPNPNLKLMPGMTASLNIMIAQENDVLKIESKALRYSPSQDILMEMRKLMMANRNKKGAPESKPGGVSGRQMPSGGMKTGGMKGMFSRDLPDGEALVWLKTEEFIRPKRIKTGLSDGSYTTILEGLEEGEVIVTGETMKNKKEQGEEQKSPFMPSKPPKR